MKSFMICCKAKELGNKITEHFKENLNKCIDNNGRTSLVVVKESQELDMLIVREMRTRA